MMDESSPTSEVERMDISIIQNDFDECVAVKLDIVDFMMILHEGKHKNKVFFVNVLDSMERLKNENESIEQE